MSTTATLIKLRAHQAVSRDPEIANLLYEAADVIIQLREEASNVEQKIEVSFDDVRRIARRITIMECIEIAKEVAEQEERDYGIASTGGAEAVVEALRELQSEV